MSYSSLSPPLLTCLGSSYQPGTSSKKGMALSGTREEGASSAVGVWAPRRTKAHVWALLATHFCSEDKKLKRGAVSDWRDSPVSGEAPLNHVQTEAAQNLDSSQTASNPSLGGCARHPSSSSHSRGTLTPKELLLTHLSLWLWLNQGGCEQPRLTVQLSRARLAAPPHSAPW